MSSNRVKHSKHKQPESEWQWDDAAQDHFRQWTDETGELRSEWLRQTPRVDLDSAFPTLSINENEEPVESQGYTYAQPAASSSQFQGGHAQSEAAYLAQGHDVLDQGGYDQAYADPAYADGTYAPTDGGDGQLGHGYNDSDPYLQAQAAGPHHSKAHVDGTSSRKGKGKGKAADEKAPSKRSDAKRPNKKEKSTEKIETGKKKSGKSKAQDTLHPQPSQTGEPGTPFYTKPKRHQQPEAHHHEDHRNAPRSARANPRQHGSVTGATDDGTAAADGAYHGTANAPYASTPADGYGPNAYATGLTEQTTGLGTEGYEDNEPDIQAAINESNNLAFNTAYQAPYGQGYDIGGPSTEDPYGAANEVEDVVPPLSAPGAHGEWIQGTLGDHERHDSRYRVEPSHKFEPGTVFKVLWSEPQGHNATIPGNYTEVAKKDTTYIGFRRFIVVGQDEGHSTCVPIYTYLGQGCKKKGVKADRHGIVYEARSKPRMTDGEPKLGFAPVCMRIDVGGEHLAKESRINYSKLVTVEHNVKIFLIGRIVGDDFNNTVANAVNACWDRKVRASMGQY